MYDVGRSYLSQCHLSICSRNGEGSSSLLFVENRGPVHVGISDAIVTVDVQRAGIAPIPSIAPKFDTAETAPEESTCFRADAEADAKVYTKFDSAKYILHKMRKIVKFKILPTASR